MTPTRRKKLKKRKGMILIISLLIMAMMSIIGAAAMSRSRVDMRVTYNTRVSKNAFYIADAGMEISPKLIRKTIEYAEVPSMDALTISSDFLDEIMGFSGGDPLADGVTQTPPTYDFTTHLGDSNCLVDIDRKGQSIASGSSAEFASGAEGTGSGSAGSIHVYYTLDSLGYFDVDGLVVAGDNPRTRLDAYYRYVHGVAGGK